MPWLELEQTVQRELAENPALELASVPGWRDRGATVSSAAELTRIASRPPVLEELERELRLIAPGHCVAAAIYLLYSLDSRGYLTVARDALADEMGTSLQVVDEALEALHQLDPPGIGARDPRECLLLQCHRLEQEGVDCEPARRILTEAWDDFAHLNWEGVARKVGLSIDAVEAAREFVARNLYPYPLHITGSTLRGTVLPQPDLMVTRESQEGRVLYGIQIPAEEVWGLRISDSFQRFEPLGEASAMSGSEQAWVRTHVERARLFMAALDQRWRTLRRVGEYLIEHQSGFLDHGPRELRPLTRAAVAQSLGVHESTVSRAVSEKTVQLPGGRLLPLSVFFETGLPIKQAIAAVVAGSNGRLSDREISVRLKSEGFNLARRTVAKYRQEMRSVRVASGILIPRDRHPVPPPFV